MHEVLVDMFEKSSFSNKVYIIRHLLNMRVKEGSNISGHINEFNNLVPRLFLVSIKFDDGLQALFLLSSVPIIEMG